MSEQGINSSDQMSGLRKQRRRPRPKKGVVALSASATAFTPRQVATSVDSISVATSDTDLTYGRRGRGRRNPRGSAGRPHQQRQNQVTPTQQIAETAHVLHTDTASLVHEMKEAETIMERLQQALARNVYECCICCDIIKRHQPVFEDQNCWAVFHLSCITKWVKRSLLPESGPAQDSWRCPACNTQNTEVPGQYTCWCTKQIQPEVSRTEPHSCGQTCGKSRGGSCPHPCSLPCHPGPCAPCMNLGPQQLCFCGKNSTQRRCIDTDYDSGAWPCQEVCGELLPCDEHACARICHPGLCGTCTVLSESHCYCGKESKPVACGNRVQSHRGYDHMGNVIDGSWTCVNRCERLYDCQVHKCQKSCHTKSTTEPTRCPRSPQLVETCHCTQTKLTDILDAPRVSCNDPIPSCGKVCQQKLPCGHSCQDKCHAGACPECTHEVDVPCQCGSTQVSTTCQDLQVGLQPSCERICRASLSCQRHICQNRCCSGLPLAQARIARRPKGRQAAQLAARNEDIEAEHFCTKSCGKDLTCGNHSCGVMCHSGPCPTCLIASFDDLTCHCGRTAIRAPIACGTKPPICTLPCNRPTRCGHPTVSHNCHLDDTECPRCPYLVERLCMCSKTMVKNQPCWKTNISCGQICQKPLACGHHTCQKRCHEIGECETPCRQVCGKFRSGCGHLCIEPCHNGDCPQNADHPCKASVMATCACGNTRMSVRCNSQDPDPDKQNVRYLKCTDFCAITERNKKLSAALGVPESHKPVQSVLYDGETLEYYKENKIWCSTIEQAFRTFLSSPDKVKNFKPMKANLRKFVHEMAEAYQMRSVSYDEEPLRNVQISKTEHSVAPTKSLGQASLASGSASVDGIEQLEKKRGNAYNAFVLVALKFGMTQDELQASLAELLQTALLQLNCKTEFSDDAELAFLVPQNKELSTEDVEVELWKSRSSLRQLATKAGLANTVELCWIDRDGHMSYRESRKHLKATGHLKKPVTNVSNSFDALTLEAAAGIDEQEDEKES